jgi:sigma-B regulation protein RsbU (phosphoserine phosphatase)
VLRKPRFWLGVLLAWVCVFQGMMVYTTIDDLQRGESKPGLPLQFGARLQIISGLTAEAREAGVRWGDVLEMVDGKPFSNMSVLYAAVMSRKPGDLLPVTVRSPKGTPFSVSVQIPAQQSGPSTRLDWVGQILLSIALPAFCLALGFWVAFIRPKDKLAWLLLALMIGFAGLPQDFPIWSWPGWLGALVWWCVFASKFGLWVMWMLFFVILFPTPMRLDQKLPWLKWALALPLILNTGVLLIWIIGRQISFAAIEFLRRPLQLILLFRTDLVLPALVILIFVIGIGLKSLTRGSHDAQRRLRILFLGSLVSLGPVLIQVARSGLHHGDLLGDAGPLEYFATLLPLLIFPLTLAYVIVVRRAMDVQTTIRQGIQYALAQRGLTVLQVVVTAGVIGGIGYLSSSQNTSLAVRIETIAAGFLVILLFRRGAQWLAQWIDRRFFREAYNNEQVLNELALRLRTLMEEKTLIQTVTQQIASALHVPRMSFLLNGGGAFTPAFSTSSKVDPAFMLAESGGVVRHLKVAQKASAIYFDDEKNWIQTIHPDEQATLRQAQMEVVLPVAVKDKLLGVLTLGPKQSEAPYTDRDLRLLDAVATQTGFALENSRLTTDVAKEIATREKLSREMEIAREVQERLFPQSFPPVAGVDYFGTCRPALACGGDYYDFLTLPSGMLCLAIGDVSGKGIAAALLMASLQASLRGQAMQNGHELAGQIVVVNRLIYDASTVNRYATFFYAQYDPQTRELEYVNAGHNPPMVLRRNGEGQWEVIRLETGGPVVGLLPKAPYLQGRVQLKENDLFVGFTDGITEAMNGADEEWGEERMIAMLERCDGDDAAGIAKAVIAAADAFVAGAPQHDDMTVLTMRVMAS